MKSEDIKNISSYVSFEELVKWTSELVSIPSYSGLPFQEKAAAEYIHGVLAAEGIKSRIDNPGQGRCSVLALMHGSGGGPSLMLNGHTDTVPAYDMEKAFHPTMKNGLLHGRGTSDMKGPLAAMMGALIAIKRSGTKLKGDLMFSAVADEEQGSIGAIGLLEKGIRADAVIVGEAMGKDSIAIAQKGLEWFEFILHGKTVHGGTQSEGVNAILKATKLINALQEKLEPRLKKRTHPLMGTPTLNIGVIKGGTQLSTVPGECIVQMDRRFIPGLETYESMVQELTEIIADLSREDPDFKCTLRVLDSSIMKDDYVHQGMVQKEDDLLVQVVKNSLEKISGRPSHLIGCPCWTDAGLFGFYGGMPTVIYGPGDLAKSHSKEESIDPHAIQESQQVYVAAALEFCGIDG